MAANGVVEGRVLNGDVFEGHYARLFTEGDGSCFFHSVAAALNWHNYRALRGAEKVAAGLEFRRRVCSATNYEWFMKKMGIDPGVLTCEDEDGEPLMMSAEQAACPTNDANELLFRLSATVLGVTVVVVRGPREMYCHPDVPSPEAPCVLVAWVNACHFEPILRLRSSDAHPLPAATEEIFARVDHGTEAARHSAVVLRSGDDGMQGVFRSDDPVVAELLAMLKS